MKAVNKHTNRHSNQNSSHISRRLGIFILLALFSNLPTSAAEPETEHLQNLIQYSLQCHATIGTIESVSVVELVGVDGTSLIARGTYKQRVAGAGISMLRFPEMAGGVFEGLYDAAIHRFRRIAFKISLRSGFVSPRCLNAPG